MTADQGFGDFGVTRATALLSTRFPSRYVTLIARGDAGAVMGEAPPQFLFRFGGIEGLRGYARNEFGGSTALLGRARLLLHLPPYGQEPLFRAGFFLFPPLRPALVLSGDAGWTTVSDDSRASLLRLGAVETDGVRSSYGVGLSLFEDARLHRVRLARRGRQGAVVHGIRGVLLTRSRLCGSPGTDPGTQTIGTHDQHKGPEPEMSSINRPLAGPVLAFDLEEQIAALQARRAVPPQRARGAHAGQERPLSPGAHGHAGRQRDRHAPGGQPHDAAGGEGRAALSHQRRRSTR